MPHLQLEISRDVADHAPLSDALDRLVAVFSELETVDPASLKAYARVADHWAMGAGAPAGFASLTACVLAGRSDELRGHFADVLFAEMKALFGVHDSSITVEIREMDRITYRK